MDRKTHWLKAILTIFLRPAEGGAGGVRRTPQAFEQRQQTTMLTTSITRFHLPANVPRETIQRELNEVAPLFKAVPGLIRKYFLLAADGRTGGGVYLWSSLAQAQTFSEGPLRNMVREKFSVEPEITYYDTPVIVENLPAAAS